MDQAQAWLEQVKHDNVTLGVVVLAVLVIGMAGAGVLMGSKRGTSKAPPMVRNSYIPIIGSFLKFAGDPIGCVLKAKERYGDVFTIQLVTEKVTFLLGPGPHQAFFEATDEQLDQADVYKFMTPIFGKGVVYDCPISYRRQQMRALGAALKPGNLKQYPAIIANETKMYFERKWAESGTADIHQTFADLIIQTGSATLMGPEIRNDLFDEMFKLYQELDKGLTPLSVFFPHAPIAAHRKRDVARKEIGKLFAKIITKRKQDPEASVKYGGDLVQRLMDFSYTDGTKLTEDEIAGMMVATLFAAQHTSNVTATWTALFLLENKRNGGDYLDRVMEEMAALQPDANAFREGRGIDMNVINNQPFLYACVKEAIRMHPPLIFLMRRAQQDVPVEGGKFIIPKGNMVMVSNSIAQRMENVFERPNEYLPDRWATWDISKLPKYSFIGFGAGIHTCMGESFAFLQVRTILNVLFSSYDMTLQTPFPEPDYESMVVMPHGPNIVSFKKKPLDAKQAVRATKGNAVLPSAASAAPVVKIVVDDSIKEYTLEEISQHNKRTDCWIIVRDKVYDVTQYIGLHQGGEQAIMNVAGGEATEKVEGPQHPGTVPSLLARFQVGVVKKA